MTIRTIDPAIATLLASSEPIIRYRAMVDLLDRAEDDEAVRDARRSVPNGAIVRALATPTPGRHPYGKWQGAHWRLVSLMDLGVGREVAGVDEALEAEFAWLTGRGRTPRTRKAQVIEGRARTCGSQDGNGLAVAVHFGHADDPRTVALVETLLERQWPDGGWNCDRRPEASHSSANESFAPLRGLATFAAEARDRAAAAAAQAGANRAAEFFLRHRVAWSERTAAPMHPVVVKLHFPAYWHYDVLIGLRVLALAGHIADSRTADALDLLESKRRPDGMWSADARHDKARSASASLVDVVEWTPAGNDGPHEALTLMALMVLKAAGRLD